MYRSLFSKYMTAFTLIIVVGFTILAALMASTVSTSVTESNEEQLRKTSRNICSLLEHDYENSDYTVFNRFIFYNSDYISDMISHLCPLDEDAVIIITDSEGTVLLENNLGDVGAVGGTVSSEIIRSLKNGDALEDVGRLGDYFESDNLIYADGITVGGEFCGAAFVCIAESEVNALRDVTIKTIIMTSLWVVLATLIAVYFITEKITNPLKEMSKAAKSFAAGSFDVQVPVIGHDEVAELATAFNNMAGSLAHFEDMRRTFLANVSHDLRTPMTTIAGFIDGILDGAIPPEKHEYYLGIIASEVRRLSRLVTTLLDITRIQAGERKFNMEAFDICEMGRLILISFEQKIDQKKLNVEFNCDRDKMLVSADKDAIYQIFYNLCDNAVKFSYEGAAYRVTITEKNGKTVISVYNEGQGISEDEIAFVFDRFYKSDKSRGLDKTGTGLGLYIARTIIDAHGEEIWVSSDYGKYCEFSFTLPSVSEKEQKEQKEQKESKKQ